MNPTHGRTGQAGKALSVEGCRRITSAQHNVAAYTRIIQSSANCLNLRLPVAAAAAAAAAAVMR